MWKPSGQALVAVGSLQNEEDTPEQSHHRENGTDAGWRRTSWIQAAAQLRYPDQGADSEWEMLFNLTLG